MPMHKANACKGKAGEDDGEDQGQCTGFQLFLKQKNQTICTQYQHIDGQNANMKQRKEKVQHKDGCLFPPPESGKKFKKENQKQTAEHTENIRHQHGCCPAKGTGQTEQETDQKKQSRNL